MGSFKYVPQPRVPEPRRRAVSAKTPERGNDTRPKPTRSRNVEVVLSLGSTRYFTLRGVTYRCPPVPYKLGQRMMDLRSEALEYATMVAHDGSRKHEAKLYFRAVNKMVRVLDRHMQPLGRLRRMMHALRLMQNPFAHISEGEVLEVADFFLQCRMKSSVQYTPDEEINLAL